MARRQNLLLEDQILFSLTFTNNIYCSLESNSVSLHIFIYELKIFSLYPKKQVTVNCTLRYEAFIDWFSCRLCYGYSTSLNHKFCEDRCYQLCTIPNL